MSDELDRFRPSRSIRTPLFLDTSALYPRFYDRANQHEEIAAFFDVLGSNELPYRPLFTNQYVVDELVALLLADSSHETAARAVEAIRDSKAIAVLSVTDEVFERSVEEFLQYDDQDISLTDHTIGVHADEAGVEHVLTYDGDFRTLGLNVVPDG
ncbi:MAG: PIN domain-containing protein [Halalkalicoccus sp.]